MTKSDEEKLIIESSNIEKERVGAAKNTVTSSSGLLGNNEHIKITINDTQIKNESCLEETCLLSLNKA